MPEVPFKKGAIDLKKACPEVAVHPTLPLCLLAHLRCFFCDLVRRAKGRRKQKPCLPRPFELQSKLL